MQNYIVAGIGTDVGKTVVSAILVEALKADYWKPIQCHGSDSSEVQKLVTKVIIHPPQYHFEHPVSPHQAARMEEISIDSKKIVLPTTSNALVIEMCGGLLVPTSDQELLVEAMLSWNCRWILVSRHYLGSINHTLLSHYYMQSQKLPIHGIIFNGQEHPDTERVILAKTGLKCLGRIEEESVVNKETIQKYAKRWKQHF